MGLQMSAVSPFVLVDAGDDAVIIFDTYEFARRAVSEEGHLGVL